MGGAPAAFGNVIGIRRRRGNDAGRGARAEERGMIRDYTNIAANERTFLAWVRTGIAVIALGFVIERFNLFLLTIARAVTIDAERLHIHRLEHPAGRYGGEALIGAGVMLIVISTIRFIHTARLLARDEPYTARATSVSLYFLAVLLLTIAAFSAYLAIA
jgi:putative membrane protein